MNKLLIFLDIDGVLVSYDDIHIKDSNGHSLFKKESIEALNQINNGDCEIVITSTWRLSMTLDQMQHLFIERGIKIPIKGFTIDLSKNANRSHEINYHLVEEYSVEFIELPKFIILDDVNSFERTDFKSNFFQINKFRALDIYDVRIINKSLSKL